MKKIILILIFLFLVGCTRSISEVKNEENIGKEVIVSGTVEKSFKLGELSGFILIDESDSIGVASDSLPAEGEKTTVRGTLIKDSIFGYYIKK